MKNSEQSLPPWARGPFELIRHASEHLKQDGDTDRRIALISFDNAIEVCIDVFLGLHPKVREGVEIQNVDIDKARKNFHTKLEFFYKYVKERNISIDLAMEDVIWYHQLRNQLYHSGSGLIPEKQFVEGSQSAAFIIFRTLFRLDASNYLFQVQLEDKDSALVNDLLGSPKNLNFHQLLKPSITSQIVRLVFKRKGHIMLWHSSERPDHFQRVCEMPVGGYGIQVVHWDATNKKWIEISSFKTQEESIDQIRKFLTKMRYVEFKGDLPKPFPK